MKTAGRRQSANVIDKRPMPNPFTMYGNIMAAGQDNLNKRSLGKYLGNKNKATQKKINSKTSRVKGGK